ncbi:MAG: COQ9 family protein [Alphaproteobacteria bacterium]|nr:COQ9 family protein [Alphaproteobacteria bacterium SS10]
MTAQIDEMEELRDRLLLAVMDSVPFDGWTERALRQAADMCGEDYATVERAFPRGIPQVLDRMADWADRQAVDFLLSHKVEEMRVRDRITVAVRARLEALAPYKDAVRRSMALIASPPSGRQVPGVIWRTADRFWDAAGDTATDYNRYTKRGLLSGVLVSTTLFWLTDDSDGHEATWTFLDRRIDNVLTLGKNLGRIKPVLDRADKASELPRSLLKRLAGRFGADQARGGDQPNAPGSDALH